MTAVTRLAAGALALAAIASLSACATAAAPSGGAAAPQGLPKGGSTASASAPAKSAGIDLTTLDTCGLFTKDAAEQLVGTTLADGDAVKDPTQPSCTYAPDPNSGITAQAALHTGGGAESYYHVDHDIVNHDFADVPGLGDEGHLERQGIFWKTQGVWFSITMLRLVEDDHAYDQPLIDAAKAVQAKLGK